MFGDSDVGLIHSKPAWPCHCGRKRCAGCTVFDPLPLHVHSEKGLRHPTMPDEVGPLTVHAQASS